MSDNPSVFFRAGAGQGQCTRTEGERTIETPVNFADYKFGSDRVVYVACVPAGSIARGAAIAVKGWGAAPACGSCHGGALQGVGAIPPLVGRSPTCIARQLILFCEGKRSNPGAAPMRTEVSHFILKDMIDVAAYAASRQPRVERP